MVVDPDMHDDIISVMKEHTPAIHKKHPVDSFPRLFWDQQQQASSVASTSAMKWHPLMIKWCIHLRNLSSSSYEALRQSGCISLCLPREHCETIHTFQVLLPVSLWTLTNNYFKRWRSKAVLSGRNVLYSSWTRCTLKPTWCMTNSQV